MQPKLIRGIDNYYERGIMLIVYGGRGGGGVGEVKS